MGSEPLQDSPTLIEALPHIIHYAGKTVVLKIGGSLREHGTLAEDIGWLRRLQIKLVIVHGGGALITEMLERLGHRTTFVDGRRYTDKATLDVVRTVLEGKVNGDLVSGLRANGIPAAGISGLDEGLLIARVRDARLGLVGEVTHVNTEPLTRLLDDGCVPVVAPVASGPDGQNLNVNADTAAGAIAAALQAEDFVLLTDVPGVLDKVGQLIQKISVAEIEELTQAGVASGGMVPKLEACAAALRAVPRARITDGRQPHALLRELFSDAGPGTMVVNAGSPIADRSRP